MLRTHLTMTVARVFLDDPTREHWVYELSQSLNVNTGSLFRLLTTMHEAGWLTMTTKPRGNGARAIRRIYRLSPDGGKEMRAFVET